MSTSLDMVQSGFTSLHHIFLLTTVCDGPCKVPPRIWHAMSQSFSSMVAIHLMVLFC